MGSSFDPLAAVSLSPSIPSSCCDLFFLFWSSSYPFVAKKGNRRIVPLLPTPTLPTRPLDKPNQPTTHTVHRPSTGHSSSPQSFVAPRGSLATATSREIDADSCSLFFFFLYFARQGFSHSKLGQKEKENKITKNEN